MTNNLLLEVKNLHTYFRTDEGLIKAVNGIDFQIQRGETVGLVGESGCGKSVTSLSAMRLIPEPPGWIADGQILLDGRDLLKLTESEMCKVRGNSIAMIFQEPMTSLNPTNRIGVQIVEAIRLHRNATKKEARTQALRMLEKVSIPDPEIRFNEYPFQLSGGMRQRVMIAMALSCNPQLIIADEPTTALDVTIQAQILKLMNRLKEDFGSSILLITHDMGVIAEMAERVAVMYAGLIVEYTGVIPLFTEPKHPYTRGLLNSIPNMARPIPEDKMLQAIPGIVPTLLNLPKGCSFQDRCNQVFDRCRSQEPPLIDVGSKHFVRCWLHA